MSFMQRFVNYIIIFSYLASLLNAPMAAFALSGRDILVTNSKDLSGGQVQALPFATKNHLVAPGETDAVICKHYNLSLNGFSKLNPTYKGKLKAGSLVVVPRTPLSDAMSHYLDGNNSYASALASTINVHDAKALRSSVFNSMASLAGSQISAVAGRYGTLELNLAVDQSAKDKFSLANSQFAALLPVYEKGRYSIFAQAGYHKMEGDRSIGNFGVGARYFANSYMVGGNVFFDYDITKKLGRVGLGAEYGRDFLKAAANIYVGQVSSWKTSSEHKLASGASANLVERPANGWDVRLHGYLPSMPNIGGKLMLEQYYGDNVALFGKDSLQKDPYALTVGLDYTPFPLLNFNIDYKRGKAGAHQTRVGVNLTYHLGESLAEQLNPANVANLRSLQGGRYDLVDRNNDIILNYKANPKGTDASIIDNDKSQLALDKELIKTNGKAVITYRPKTATGQPVAQLKHVVFTSNTADGLKIETAKEIKDGVYAADITAKKEGTYNLSVKVGTYNLSVKVGSVSKTPTKLLIVDPNIPGENSHLSAKDAVIAVGGKTTFTFIAEGDNNTPIDGLTNLKLVAEAKDGDLIIGNATAANNAYSFSVTAKHKGPFAFHVTYKGAMCSNVVDLRVTDPNDVDFHKSKIEAVNTSIRKKEAGRILVRLFDKNNKPVAVDPAFILPEANVNVGNLITNSNPFTFDKAKAYKGVYTIPYTVASEAKPASYIIKVKIGTTYLKSSANVNIIDGTGLPDIDSTLKFNPAKAKAGDPTEVTYTPTAASSNWPQEIGKLTIKADVPVDLGKIIFTKKNSDYIAKFNAPDEAGEYKLQVFYNGLAVSKEVPLKVVANAQTPAGNKSGLSAQLDKAHKAAKIIFAAVNAMGGRLSHLDNALSFVALDANGAALPASSYKISSIVNRGNGEYEAVVTSSKPVNIRIEPRFHNKPIGSLHEQVKLDEDEDEDADDGGNPDLARTKIIFTKPGQNGASVPTTTIPADNHSVVTLVYKPLANSIGVPGLIPRGLKFIVTLAKEKSNKDLTSASKSALPMVEADDEDFIQQLQDKMTIPTSAVQETRDTVYKVKLKTAIVGTYKIKAMIMGRENEKFIDASHEVTLTATDANLQPDKTTIFNLENENLSLGQDGTADTNVTVELKNQDDAMSGTSHASALSIKDTNYDGKVTSSPFKENPKKIGEYTAKLTFSSAGNHKIGVFYNNTLIADSTTRTITVAPHRLVPVKQYSTIDITKQGSLGKDNAIGVNAILTLRDANNHPAAAGSYVIKVPSLDGVTITQVAGDHAGSANYKITASKAGTYDLPFVVKDSSTNQDLFTLTGALDVFSDKPKKFAISLRPDVPYVAGNPAPFDVVALKNGDNLIDYDISDHIKLVDSIETTAHTSKKLSIHLTYDPDRSGYVARDFVPTIAGTHNFILQFRDTPNDPFEDAVSGAKAIVIAGPVATDHSRFTNSGASTQIEADGKDSILVNVQLRDKYDNPVSGAHKDGSDVTLEDSKESADFIYSPAIIDANTGSYNYKLSATKAGTYTIRALANGDIRLKDSVTFTAVPMVPVKDKSTLKSSEDLKVDVPSKIYYRPVNKCDAVIKDLDRTKLKLVSTNKMKASLDSAAPTDDGYVFDVTPSTAGEDKIWVTYDNAIASEKKSIKVAETDEPTKDNSTLTSDNPVVMVGKTAKFTYLAKNKSGAINKDLSNKLSVHYKAPDDKNKDELKSTIKYISDNKYEIDLISAVVSSYDIYITYNKDGTEVACSPTKTVGFAETDEPTKDNSTLTSDNPVVMVGETAKFTYLAKNKSGAINKDLSNKLSVHYKTDDDKNKDELKSTIKYISDNKYEIDLTSAVGSSYDIYITYNKDGTEVACSPTKTVGFAEAPDAEKSTFELDVDAERAARYKKYGMPIDTEIPFIFTPKRADGSIITTDLSKALGVDDNDHSHTIKCRIKDYSGGTYHLLLQSSVTSNSRNYFVAFNGMQCSRSQKLKFVYQIPFQQYSYLTASGGAMYVGKQYEFTYHPIDENGNDIDQDISKDLFLVVHHVDSSMVTGVTRGKIIRPQGSNVYHVPVKLDKPGHYLFYMLWASEEIVSGTVLLDVWDKNDPNHMPHDFGRSEVEVKAPKRVNDFARFHVVAIDNNGHPIQLSGLPDKLSCEIKTPHNHTDTVVVKPSDIVGNVWSFNYRCSEFGHYTASLLYNDSIFNTTDYDLKNDPNRFKASFIHVGDVYAYNDSKDQGIWFDPKLSTSDPDYGHSIPFTAEFNGPNGAKVKADIFATKDHRYNIIPSGGLTCTGSWTLQVTDPYGMVACTKTFNCLLDTKGLSAHAVKHYLDNSGVHLIFDLSKYKNMDLHKAFVLVLPDGKVIHTNEMSVKYIDPNMGRYEAIFVTHLDLYHLSKNRVRIMYNDGNFNTRFYLTGWCGIT